MAEGSASVDWQIATAVLGLREDQRPPWPIEIPKFSTDRNAVVLVLNELNRSDVHRDAFNRALLVLRPAGFAYVNACWLLIDCGPAEICAAALTAVRECGPTPMWSGRQRPAVQ
jgi:hypothetical protein